ncbi:flotillin domain-containing protein [Gaeumannomyces tritici R3-111a-1]|uniref:Flotillin domain-containing protein n=1 Tax=Gaeumannomyces tritici (strain R3-111a-1) TaxID=644352 RepID=J3NT62_GAET3|nr:flotillin domain-containing protein [Gaeumannomyces tritici R3-111a-1]EJT79376.1 flotillin domain-containing protein [Gaeumannomyces tritici R3-111a-1]
MSYRVAAPDEYLAITGMGIKSVRITKAAWVLPFQRCMRFSVQPHDYAMNLQAMTKEKLQFLLPVVFTIGPDVNQRGANTKGKAPETGVVHGGDHEGSDAGGSHSYGDETTREDRGDALMKYAMLLADSGNKGGSNGGGAGPSQQTFLENIVKGIIEGETRVLVSSMTMEEIFQEREVFKRRIFRNIRGELAQFGLKIYNSNVKELKDAPNSSYFESLSRKAHEGATNQARIDVAEAQLRGNVGEAQRKGEEQREIAKINADTAVQKVDRDIERAQAEANLATRKTVLNRDVEISRIEATRATEAKDEDLKQDVQRKKAAAELERLRATDVVKAAVTREVKQQAADAAAYEVTTQARADLDRNQQATNAAAYDTKTAADAQSYAIIKNADAQLQAQLKQAEGMAAMAGAYAKMSQAFGGPQGLLTYLMIEKGTFVELANANASAVQGLQPKISVWNTGPSAGDGSAGGVDAMRNVYQMLPPLMTTIQDQTGITLPSWQFGHMATEASKAEGPNGQKA